MAGANMKVLESKCGEVSELLKALSHPTRLLIMCHLAEGDRSVGELVEAVGISQSLMSQYLGRMKEEGLLGSERDGKSIRYYIEDERVFKLLKGFKTIFC